MIAEFLQHHLTTIMVRFLVECILGKMLDHNEANVKELSIYTGRRHECQQFAKGGGVAALQIVCSPIENGLPNVSAHIGGTIENGQQIDDTDMCKYVGRIAKTKLSCM